MNAIRIDFASRSFSRTIKRTRLVTWMSACLGLTLCIGAVVVALGLVRQYEMQQSEIRNIQAETKRKIDRKPLLQKLHVSEIQAGAVNTAVAQLNLPWRDVFDTIEAATPTTIALLTLEPDAKMYMLRGSAESKTSDAMIGYIEELKKQAFFDSVLLVRHEINERDPNRPIRFQFEATWPGASQ